MEIGRMAEILEAEVICGQENLHKEISLAVASDMMSDVLVSAESDRVLISGLCTIHTVLTAQILDLSAVVFVRNKVPTEEMVQTAKENDIALLRTAMTMYAACGELHKSGLKGRRRVDA